MKRYKLTDKAAPLIAGAVTAALFMLFYAIHGFYPFGERSVAWCDMDQQYVPLLMELKTVFSDGSLLLSRGGGMMNFYGVFLFFLSSPLSLLSLAVKNSDMIFFVNILLVIKTALSSASAQLYLGRVFPKLGTGFGVLMSVMYSAGGYVMMYYQNNMWIDMMIVFPLLMLSLFRLLEKGRWGAYTVCLAVCLLLNFYISFMVIVFVMMLGGAALYLCCEPQNRGSRAVRLILGDICAALISGVVWLPAFLQYTDSGRGNSLKEIYFGGYFIERNADKAALLAGSSLVLAGAVLCVVFRKSVRSGKGVLFSYGGVISLAGAFAEPVNKLLHTGSYQAYPLRYGFIVLLLVFSACGELLSERHELKKKRRAYMLTGAGLMLLAGVVTAAYTERRKLSSYANSLWVEPKAGIILSAVGLTGAAVYFICIYSFRRGHTSRLFTFAVMAAVVFGESFLSFGVNVAEINDTVPGFRRNAAAFARITDEEFVRIKAGKKYFYPNYAEGWGKYSIGHYTSLTDCGTLYALKRLGYSSHWMDMDSSGGTMLTDELLLNKYIIGSPVGKNTYYLPMNTEGGMAVYTDPNVLGGALISDTAPAELADFENVQRMEATGYIAEKLFGISGAVEKLSPDEAEGVEVSEKDGIITVDKQNEEKAELTYNIEVTGRKELYFDIFGNYSTDVEEDYYEAADIYVNGTRVQAAYPESYCCGILDLGTFEDESVEVKISVLRDISVSVFGVWLYDADRVNEALAAAETADVSVKGSKVKVGAVKGGYVYLPVAFSKGWSCSINGRKAPVIRTLGAFMAIEMPEGGSAELSFCPSGLRAGAVLSGAGLVMFVLLLIVIRRKKVSNTAGNAAKKCLYVLSAVTVGVFYIAAPVVWTAVNVISLIVGG
ncbi:YfhO family protein [Ruminococcus flavefaciens]|uniref:YfhO family protein n=1 Tax=Ruminococcus flavefaciens TaxID=1265 RepID=UPI0002EC009B|nr:YfhO family protein [Ruminococcus flavefaciens]